MKGIHIDDLVAKTVSFMVLNNLKNLDLSHSARHEQSCWGRLSEFVFNVSFSYNLASRLRMAWKCNSEHFQTKVIEKITNKHLSNKMESSTIIDYQNAIFFVKLDFFRLFVYGQGKQWLSAHFTRFLSKKLQKNGINCWLTCIRNHVNKYPVLCGGGKFKCISKKCNKVYKVTFLKVFDDQSIKMVVSFDDFSSHKKINEPAYRIIGEERKELGVRLLAKGTTNVRNEHILSNARSIGKFIKNTNRNTLATIKHEARHERDFFNNINADAAAAKFMLDKLCLVECNLVGYMQFLSHIPYGFLLMCGVELNIWLNIQEKDPECFFDATGSVMTSVPNQKNSLFYSMVCHDKTKKVISPIFSFVTTSHTQPSISSYLFLAESILLNHITIKSKMVIAPIIVVDFSWALINSVLKVFNGLRVSEYLEVCYNIIFCQENENDKLYEKSLRTRVYLCAAHMIKNIVKKTKTLTNNKEVRRAFTYSFSLLQNSQTINEFLHYYEKINFMFRLKYESDKFNIAVEYLRNEIANRHLETIDVDDDSIDMKKAKLLADTNMECERETAKNLKTFSRFTKFFESHTTRLKQTIENDNSFNFGENAENMYFCPALMDIIDGYLHLLPLWTGIILKKWYDRNPKYTCKTRLTNNMVENSFGHLKHNILNKQKVLPSTLTSLLYQNSEAAYIEHYSNTIIKYKAPSTKNKTKKDKLISQEIEKWCRRKQAVRKIKGIYYKSIKNFAVKQEEIQKEINNYYSKIFQKTFSRHMDKIYALGEKMFDEIEFSSFQIIKRHYDENVEKYRTIEESLCKKSTRQYNNEQVDYSFEKIINVHQKLKGNFVPVKTEADGNCLYNSILYNIEFNFTNNAYKTLRVAIIHILFKYEFYFRSLLNNTGSMLSFDAFIEEIAENDSWGNEYCLQALSILFEKPIYSYSMNNRQEPFSSLFNATFSDKQPICIGFHINHFVAILPKKNNFIGDLPKNDQFQKFELKNFI